MSCFAVAAASSIEITIVVPGVGLELSNHDLNVEVAENTLLQLP
jgi:hypothetical protein